MRKIVVLLISLIFFSNANARHLKGGWIHYQYLSHNTANNTNKYRVTVRQYLETSSTSSQIDLKVSLGIFNAINDTLVSVVSINLTSDSNIIKSVYPPCMTNAPYAAYKIDTYVADIDLPQSSNGYILAVQRCCRAADIVNVVNSDSVGFTYNAKIPGVIAGTNYFVNTSPYFLTNDTAVVCAKNMINLLLNATDADGDSLSYSFCDGLNGADVTNPKPLPPYNPPYIAIPYKAPFSGASPLGSLVTINSKTGLISGIAPNIIGDYVVAVCAYEYRNGVLIGTTKKEIHIEVGDCELAAVLLDSAYTNCESYTMQFTNKAVGALVTSYQWDFGEKNKTTDTSSLSNPSYTYTDTGTYTIKLKVTAAGGCIDSATSTVKIYPIFPLQPIIKASCYLSPVYFMDSSFFKYITPPKYHWTLAYMDTSSSPNPIRLYASSGFYSIKLFVENGVCKSDTISTSFVLPSWIVQSCAIMASTTDTILAGDTIMFTAKPINAGDNYTYQWIKNGANIIGAVNNVFIANTLQNNDTIACLITSMDTCILNKLVLSNNIIVAVKQASNISGHFISLKGDAVKNILLNVNGTASIKYAGDYNFAVVNGGDYVLKPTKNSDVKKNNGISSIDVILTQRHILNIAKLNSPYKLIAADVNNNKTISNIDIIFMKRLILGIDTTFTGNRLWAFVDSAYTFPDTTNPFPYKDSISFTNLTSNKINQTFIGVKLGDVNYDWNATVARGKSIDNVELIIDNAEPKIDKQLSTVNYQLPIKVKNFKDLTALQYTLHFNHDLYEFVAIKNNKLAIEYNATQANQTGNISFLWADAKGAEKTLEDDSELFTLVLRSKWGKVNSEWDNRILELGISNDITEIEAWDKNNQQHNIIFTKQATKNEQQETRNESFSVSPNPNDGNIIISLLSNTNKVIVFELSNAAGKTLYSQSFEAVKGNNVYQLNLKKKSRLPSGLYFIKAKGLDGDNVKKIVVSD